ncbi:hypothetical protein KXX57_004749, partial [Aspergillus fumigatus]
MADSLAYDYTSWQFLEGIGQASPLQQELQTEDDLRLAFELSSHGRSENDIALLSSDNCLPDGQISAKAATAATGIVQAQMHSPPIEVGMGMGMDLDMAMAMAMEMDLTMEMFAQGMDFISVPPFPDLSLGHGQKAPDDLSFLRSTSDDVTQRALFMTPSGITSPSSSSSSPSFASTSPSSHRNSSSPSLDPCTPSATSSTSKEDEDYDWDCDRDRDPSLGTGQGMDMGMHFYKLPDRLDSSSSSSSSSSSPRPPRLHRPHHHPTQPSPRRINHRASAAADDEDALTPLEMPDGSTRFTANWLPVDPTGGFTIDSPESASASAMDVGDPYGHGYSPQDRAYGYGYAEGDLAMEFSKEAFIQMPAPAPV